MTLTMRVRWFLAGFVSGILACFAVAMLTGYSGEFWNVHVRTLHD